MTASNEPTRAAPAERNLRRKWVYARRVRAGNLTAHMISGPDPNKPGQYVTFCGKSMKVRPDDPDQVMGEDWCPVDHPKHVCPRCLKWWEAVRPGQHGRKKVAASST